MNRLIVLTLICFSVFVCVFSSAAQESFPISPGMTAEGEIAADSTQAVWTFFGLRDQMVSIVVEGQAGFDPVLLLQMTNGSTVITNDDAVYPDVRDAVVEGISLPATGDYEIVVTGYEGSTGEFQLHFLPGYADLIYQTRFDAPSDWESEGPIAVDNSTAAIEGVAETGILLNQVVDPIEDGYAQISVGAINGPGGWTVGLQLRQSSSGSYHALVNSSGTWRIVYESSSGEERILRDWSPHPAIVPGETSFTLAALINGSVAEVFYNHQLLGRVVDSQSTDAGRVGVVVMSPNALTNNVSVELGEFLATERFQVDGEYVRTQQLVRGNIAITTQELERRQVIPSGGRMLLSVGESFIENRNPGVQRLFLGQGIQPAEFAMGTTAIPAVNGEGTSGCGVIFHSVDDTHYTVAFADNTGGYGLSSRAGDTFLDGVYGVSDQLIPENGIPILVVVVNGELSLYINNAFVGSTQMDYPAGEVGNVIVNFDPVDARCTFSDTWLWTWETDS